MKHTVSSSPPKNLLTTCFKPSVWDRITRRVWPWSLGLGIVLFALGVYWTMMVTPADYQQGEVFKILYVHVPAAWWAVGLYGVLSILSLLYLLSRHPVVAILSRAIASVGMVCTLVCLATGALWGKPMWGAYWVWDARLTSVAVLAVLYGSFIWIWGAYAMPTKGWRMAAFIGFFGALNLPIIKWSVTWWQTLHQPATFFKTGGAAMDPSMLPALVVMTLAYGAYCVSVVALWYRTLYRYHQTYWLDDGKRLQTEGTSS